jgi:hypothetical protein
VSVIWRLVVSIMSLLCAHVAPVHHVRPKSPKAPLQRRGIVPSVAVPDAPMPDVSMPGASIWACIRSHESGDDYGADTGNGYYGAYQFAAATWAALRTGYARADLAPPAVQDRAAVELQRLAGWGQWSTAAGCGA